MKLYIYDHCPYCVKARMIFGLKNLDFELVTLLNDDEKTPKQMIGQKMVPILKKEDGSYMPESMDIVNYIDENHGSKILTGEKNGDIAKWLENSRNYAYSLAMPRWAQVDMEEFATQSAIDYFVNKKEKMIGDFQQNIANSQEFIDFAELQLEELSKLIKSDTAVNGEFSEDDIHLFAVLRSLSIVKGLNFPEKVENYMHKISEQTNIPLHFDIAV